MILSKSLWILLLAFSSFAIVVEGQSSEIVMRFNVQKNSIVIANSYPENRDCRFVRDDPHIENISVSKEENGEFKFEVNGPAYGSKMYLSSFDRSEGTLVNYAILSVSNQSLNYERVVVNRHIYNSVYSMRIYNDGLNYVIEMSETDKWGGDTYQCSLKGILESVL